MSAQDPGAPRRLVAVVGNPNVGKSTLLNRLGGTRTKTANFPGTTQEALVVERGDTAWVDLPGVYSLALSSSEALVTRGVIEGAIAPRGMNADDPAAVLLVMDATNLMRNLTLAGELLAHKVPTVVALNMTDLARKRGITIDTGALEDCLGCAVVACSARTGEGVDKIGPLVEAARVPTRSAPTTIDELERWGEEIYAQAAAPRSTPIDDTLTDRLDRAFTHPLLGVLTFAAVMTGLFYVIFKLATVPMDLIEAWFGSLGSFVSGALPEGAVRELLVDGVIAGIGGTLVFLPQIVLLFFLLALLEGTGYLARAAFVIDRVLRPFGLSGHAFVPLLSSHACAIPGIMAARAVPDPKDRLATILVAPFMSCSARIPVYVLMTGLLFPDEPGKQALAFTSCYVVGALAGLLSALLARRTILKGPGRPMAMELPSYHAPDLRGAVMLTLDRAKLFLRKAGTMILAISVVLWWLSAYPKADTVPPQATELRQEATLASDTERIEALESRADTIEARHIVSNTALGRIGSFVQPVFEPLGYDRQLTVGVLASFAAREVFVSTMAIQVAGTDDAESEGVLHSIATAERDSGEPLFDAPTSWSLLVFYILAMQCLPTLVVTAKEAGGWRWAALQFGWMSALAYIGALAAYQIAAAVGA